MEPFTGSDHGHALAPFTGSYGTRLNVSGGPVVKFAPSAAIPLALCLHELATNAVKYGALSNESGQVDCSWFERAPGAYTLVWVESGFTDAQGQLFLTGRCAQLIRRDDQVLAPFVWEDKLLRHHGVVRGTLIEREGAIVAVVQAASGADRNTLAAELRSAHEELADVAFIERMPMDPRHQSKIDQEALRRMIGL